MKEHAQRFRFDRRLQQRRGTVPSDNVDKEMAALQDVSEKGELVESPQFKGDGASDAEGGGQ